MSQSHGRTIGGELLRNYAFCKLGFPKMLKSFGFNQEQIHHAALQVIGRLLHPAGELETVYWAKNVSALGELLGTDFSHIRENSLYRASDLLMKHQDAIESHLARTERRLFGLNEKIILYDLTNTYLEGAFEGSKKAKRDYSKDKRKDCPLLTLALVVDEDGFPKGSKVFPGNVSEPDTLKEILEGLKVMRNSHLSLFEDKTTIVIDAGVATEDNLNLLLSEGYHYACVSRTRLEEIPAEGFLEFETRSGGEVFVKKMEVGKETFLYCQSEGRKKKEGGMKFRFMKRVSRRGWKPLNVH